MEIGYLLTNTTTPDQYQVNADGAWIVNGVVQVKQLENTMNNTSAASNCFVDLSTYFASDFRSYDIMQPGSPLIKIEGKVNRFFNGVPNEDDYPADEIARIAEKAGAKVELKREKREVRNLWDSQGNAIASKGRWIENVHVTIYYNGYQYKYSSDELTDKYVTVTKY